MKTIGSILIMWLGLITANAQEFTGRLLDGMDNPIEYANIVVLSPSDSSFIAGTVSDTDGIFTINAPVKTVVKFSYIGFEDEYRTITDTLTKQLGDIHLKEQYIGLNEVTITAGKPVFKQKNGALVTDVAGSLLSRYHNITDVLSCIPGIVRTIDGTFEVFGLGSPIIYINNRKVQSLDEVKQLDPKNIKSVELITNPGARYDAAGKAVLRISTIKKEEGWAMQLHHESLLGEAYSHNENIRFDIKKGKADFSAYYALMNDKGKALQPAVKELFTKENIYKYVQDQHDKRLERTHTWRANLDYELNKNHIVGFNLDGSITKDEIERYSDLDYLVNDKMNNEKNIDNDYDNKTTFTHVNLFYNANWQKHLSTELNLDYVNNKNNYDQNTIEDDKKEELITLSNGKGNFNIWAGQFVMNYNKNKIFNLSAGIDYNYVDGTSSLNSSSDIVSISDFDETEKRIAGFIEWNFAVNDLSANIGIRYEKMKSSYIDRLDKENNIDRTYNNLFPSFNINYQKGSWSQSLSFTSRINRPSFSQLSNSTYYMNEFMYQRGNPLLKPAISYVVQWSTGYKFINFNASYTYTKDFITTAFEEENTNRIISTFQNYDHIQYLKANLNLQKRFGVWNPSVSFGVTKQFFKLTYRGNIQKYNAPSYSLTINQMFNFPKDYLLSIYYYLSNGGDRGCVSFRTYQMLNLEIQKNFLDNRCSISLNANDIFRTMKFKETKKVGNISFQQTEDYRLWNYSISLVYRFNQIKSKYRGKNTIQSDINRL